MARYSFLLLTQYFKNKYPDDSLCTLRYLLGQFQGPNEGEGLSQYAIQGAQKS